MLASLLTELETWLAGGLREDAGATGLLEATARVLLALEDDGMPMSALASRVGRDATTATRFVNRAEADGLVRRRPGTEDRRRRIVGLTEEGRVVRERLRDVRAARAATFLETVLGETGLHEGQVEWFLEGMLVGLRKEPARPSVS